MDPDCFRSSSACGLRVLRHGKHQWRVRVCLVRSRKLPRPCSCHPRIGRDRFHFSEQSSSAAVGNAVASRCLQCT
jgi:hypothetical protein